MYNQWLFLVAAVNGLKGRDIRNFLITSFDDYLMATLPVQAAIENVPFLYDDAL